MAPLKILISGGGIAGPCLAWWLDKADVAAEITIIERAPEPRPSGQAVDIRGAAVKVIKAMGLEQAVREKHTTEKGFEFVYSDGVSKARIDASGDDTNQSLTSEYEILRGDLARLLYDATKEKARIKYIFGETIKEIYQDEDSDQVRVAFTNNLPEDYYDLAVGADGQISRTRRLVFGHGPQNDDYLHRLGEYMAYFTIPKISSDTKYAQWYTTIGGRLVMTRPSPYSDTRAYLAVCDRNFKRFDDISDALKNKDEMKAKDWIKKEFGGAGWEIARILDGMNKADDFYMQEIVQVKMRDEGFAKGRVALLGDAAYCPSPLSGMGTSLAIVGSYVLAGEIASSPADVPGALQRYSTVLRPFSDQCQKLIPGMPHIGIPQSAVGVQAIGYFVSFITSSLVRRIGPWLHWALPRDIQRDKWQLPKRYHGLPIET